MGPALRIASIKDLDRLAREGTSLIGKRRPVLLEFADLSPEEAERWERRINRNYQSCGCEYGAAFFLCSLAGVVAYWLLQDNQSVFSLWAKIGYSVPVVVACMVIGKVIGQLIAKRRLNKGVRALKARLSKQWSAASLGVGMA